MTTTVKVFAHCAEDKEVKITHLDELGEHTTTLQDGQEFECVVYDEKSCSVIEVEK